MKYYHSCDIAPERSDDRATMNDSRGVRSDGRAPGTGAGRDGTPGDGCTDNVDFDRTDTKSLLLQESLAAYWSAPELETNIIIFLNPLGALLPGAAGRIRAFLPRGWAADMRTYGLVCMMSVSKLG